MLETQSPNYDAQEVNTSANNKKKDSSRIPSESPGHTTFMKPFTAFQLDHIGADSKNTKGLLVGPNWKFSIAFSARITLILFPYKPILEHGVNSAKTTDEDRTSNVYQPIVLFEKKRSNTTWHVHHGLWFLRSLLHVPELLPASPGCYIT